MQNIFFVARHEFLNYFRRPSFLVATLGIPLVAIVLALFSALFSSDERVEPVLDVGRVEEAPTLRESGQIGVVDGSDLVERIRPSFVGTFLRYETVEEAEGALEAGEIDVYFRVAPDYLATGEVERVARRLEPFPRDTFLMQSLLKANLLSGVDPAYRERIEEPVSAQWLEIEYVGAPPADQTPQAAQEEGGAFGLAYLLAMLLYTTIFMAAAFLLQSVVTEKENRIMEVLLTSIRPVELLAGKVIGLGLLGLGQTMIWGLSAYFAAWLSFSELSLNGLGIGWQLGAMIVLYFLLGYGMFSVMMAGVGALMPTVRASGPATMLVIMPAILPLMLLAPLTERPHSLLAVALSLIPFTSPLTMIVRLSQGGVPLWQIAASILTISLTIPLLLIGVARLFQAQSLLSSDDFSLRRAFAILRQN
ncbi:MAG: ABC transporter permease [Ardenticatenaceae bacterium]